MSGVRCRGSGVLACRDFGLVLNGLRLDSTTAKDPWMRTRSFVNESVRSKVGTGGVGRLCQSGVDLAEPLPRNQLKIFESTLQLC